MFGASRYGIRECSGGCSSTHRVFGAGAGDGARVHTKTAHGRDGAEKEALAGEFPADSAPTAFEADL